ncbi:acyltransferase [Anaerocolumna xylanovorans]|uniref:Surface polysaccharide O-acyltransferase, integral membrane enzyme n=1 Tax=Anaerocolumna xylanovorans DSM 12503 TaxID=1121345 RepID=A0A1M7YCB2_9FIRM|nr:acyltransferase family protein [Anaerocolumna xylanovorans]SHO50253.1 Surface polysaccharide O-acyltransferase, integral membrane enzyme [Anaerocolumna xylanovorans DSM 12503]
MKRKTIINEQAAKARIYYLDILRVLSILAVITIHVTATNVSAIRNMDTFHWWFVNILNSFSRSAVPIFFMISGALLLGNEKNGNIKEFLKKRLPRIGIPFLVWSIVYCVLKHYVIEPDYPGIFSFGKIMVKEILQDSVYHHLWFVYIMLAMYFVIPFVNKIIKNAAKEELQFFIVMWFFVTIAYTTFQGIYYIKTEQYFYIRFLDIPFYSGYLGFFILGYYLKNQEFSKKMRGIIYAAGGSAMLAAPILTYLITRGKDVLNELFYGNFSITTFLSAVAVFILFKNIAWEEKINKRLMRLIISMSEATFGIYLIHLLVQIYLVRCIETSSKSIAAFASVSDVVTIAAVFMISFFIVKLINLNSRISKILFG